MLLVLVSASSAAAREAVGSYIPQQPELRSFIHACTLAPLPQPAGQLHTLLEACRAHRLAAKWRLQHAQVAGSNAAALRERLRSDRQLQAAAELELLFMQEVSPAGQGDSSQLQQPTDGTTGLPTAPQQPFSPPAAGVGIASTKAAAGARDRPPPPTAVGSPAPATAWWRKPPMEGRSSTDTFPSGVGFSQLANKLRSLEKQTSRRPAPGESIPNTSQRGTQSSQSGPGPPSRLSAREMPSDATPPGGSQTEVSELAPGWKKAVDSRSGRIYYWNEQTRTTSWEAPKDGAGSSAGSPNTQVWSRRSQSSTGAAPQSAFKMPSWMSGDSKAANGAESAAMKKATVFLGALFALAGASLFL